MITVIEHESNPVNDQSMINVTKRCDDCDNSVICKYKEAFEECVQGLDKTDFPEIMHMDVSCRYYKHTPTVKHVDMQGREHSNNTPIIKQCSKKFRED